MASDGPVASVLTVREGAHAASLTVEGRDLHVDFDRVFPASASTRQARADAARARRLSAHGTPALQIYEAAVAPFVAEAVAGRRCAVLGLGDAVGTTFALQVRFSAARRTAHC